MAEDMQANVQDTAQATQTVDDLKAKYGKVFQVTSTVEPDDDTTVDFTFIFKKASAASYDRYMKTASGGMLKATQTFLRDNITDEYEAALEKAFADYPALAISLAEKLLGQLGLSKTTNLKSL